MELRLRGGARAIYFHMAADQIVLLGLCQGRTCLREDRATEVHTSGQISAHGRRRPVGCEQAVTKEAVKIRLDANILAAP